MTVEDFVAALAAEVPEVAPIVQEHIRDNGGLLLHLLTADLRRYAIEAFNSGASDVVRRLLSLIDRAPREGTDSVTNAMAESFVEDTGWWDDEMQPFIATWPEGLKAEAENQRAWRRP